MAYAPPRSVSLTRHAATPSAAVRTIDVEISTDDEGALRLRFFLDGDVAGIKLPTPAPPRHVDGLWNHTCFEAFVAGEDSTAYCEFNFSLSGEWAAYGFTRYREGMAPLEPATPPLVAASITDDRIALEAVVPRDALLSLPGEHALRLALAAVIEERDGRYSYWALMHPRPRPDFHDPGSFVLQISRSGPW